MDKYQRYIQINLLKDYFEHGVTDEKVDKIQKAFYEYVKNNGQIYYLREDRDKGVINVGRDVVVGDIEKIDFQQHKFIHYYAELLVKFRSYVINSDIMEIDPSKKLMLIKELPNGDVKIIKIYQGFKLK